MPQTSRASDKPIRNLKACHSWHRTRLKRPNSNLIEAFCVWLSMFAQGLYEAFMFACIVEISCIPASYTSIYTSPVNCLVIIVNCCVKERASRWEGMGTDGGGAFLDWNFDSGEPLNPKKMLMEKEKWVLRPKRIIFDELDRTASRKYLFSICTESCGLINTASTFSFVFYANYVSAHNNSYSSCRLWIRFVPFPIQIYMW